MLPNRLPNKPQQGDLLDEGAEGVPTSLFG